MPADVWSILDHAISRMTRRIVARHVFRRLIICLALLLVALLSLVIADHTLHGGLPDAWTWPAAMIALGACLVAAAALVAFAVLRRWNPVLAAWHIERYVGGTYNSVINAVLLRRDAPELPAGDAVARRAVVDVRETGGYARPAATRADRRPLLALLAVAAAWLVFTIVTPKSVSQSLARLVGAHLPAPTMTRLEWLSPGPSDGIYSGQPLDVRVAVRGRIVPQVDCEWSALAPSAAGAAGRRAMSRAAGADQIWSAQFVGHETSADFRVAIVAGDARIERDIRVRPYPDALAAKFAIRPPAYTGLPAETVDSADVTAPQGAELSLEILANVEIRNPVFAFDDEQHARTRMIVPPDDARRAGLTFRAERDARYHVEFADPWGMIRQYPPTHTIHVIVDQPPRVTITMPAAAERPRDGVDLATLLSIDADASDDYGLRDLVFVVSGDGLGETRIPIHSADTAPTIPLDAPGSDEAKPHVASDDSRRTHARATVPVSRIPLPVGRSAQAWFEARDNRVAPDGGDSPQSTRSDVLTIRRPAEQPSNSDQPSNPGANRKSAGATGETGESQPGGAGKQARKAGAARDATAASGSKGQKSGASEPRDDGSDASGDPTDDFMKANEQKLRDVARKLAQGDKNREDGDSKDGRHDDSTKSARGDGGDDAHSDASAQTEARDRPGDGASGSSQPPSQSKSPQGQADRQAGQPQAATPDGGDSRDGAKSSAGKSGDADKRDQGSSPNEKPASNADHRAGDPNQGRPPSDEPAEKGIPASGSGAENRQSDKTGGESEQGSEKTSGGDRAERSGEKSDQPPASPEQEGGAGDQKRGQSGGDGQSDAPPSKAPGQPENPPQNKKESPPSKPEDRQTSAEKGEAGRDSNSSGQGQGANQSGSSGQDGQSNQAGSNRSNDPSFGESDSGSNPRDGGGKGRSKTGEGQAGGKGDAAQGGSGGSESPNSAGSNQSGASPGGGLDEDSAAAQGGGKSAPPPASQPSPAPEPQPEDRPGAGAAAIDSEGRPELADTLERLLRSGGVTPEIAQELGWSDEQAASFNRALERLRDQGQRGESVDPQREKIRSQVAPDNAQQARARRADADFRTSADRGEDRLRQITPPAEQKISPQLRSILDAYYRSMASGEIRKNEPKKP